MHPQFFLTFPPYTHPRPPPNLPLAQSKKKKKKKKKILGKKKKKTFFFFFGTPIFFNNTLYTLPYTLPMQSIVQLLESTGIFRNHIL